MNGAVGSVAPRISGARAFTIIELLIVMAVILVLAGLILGTSGYVQKKGARSRAEAEIAAMSAALESYKADNGVYPRDAANKTTDNLDARASSDPSSYQSASLFLYGEISGMAPNRSPKPNVKSYFVFRPNMLTPRDQAANVTAIADPFGNSYGYSTAFQADPTKGYNPTFDLWSTAGETGGTPDPAKWIKNW